MNAALTSGVNASSDYVNFLINALLDRSNPGFIVNVLIADSRHPSQRMLNIGDKNKRSFLNPQLTVGDNFPLQQFNKNGEGAVLMNVSDDFRNDSFAGLRSARMEGSGITPRVSTAEDSKWNTLLTNDDRYFLGYYSIGIGRYVSAGAERPFGTSGKVAAEKSIVIGFKAEVRENLSIALGADTIAVEKYGIAMGASSITLSEGAMAIGYKARAGKVNDQGIFNVRNLAKYATALDFQAEAMAESSVALGAYSFVDTAADYVPFGRNIRDDKGYVWKSTLGAISVGNLEKEQTRQIIGVAACTQDTDAVNVAQLKAVESSAGSWQTSVNGKDNMVVSTGKTVGFSTGSDNLAIIKESTDSGISLKFDLAKEIKLNKITLGTNALDATGLIITDGPSITTTGINAGNKKITGLDKGTEDSDAVNFLQLNEFKKQVEGSQLVKQDASTKNITIGKEAEGTTINIANKDGANRIISSVEDGRGSHDAVNKGQLDNSIRSVNNNITNKFDELTQNITNVTQKIEGNFLLWSEADHAFVAQHNEGEQKTNSKLTFPLKGDIYANSTDAITGSQLYDLGSKVAKYFGGSANYENGTWVATLFKFQKVDSDGKIEEGSYDSVASAFTGVGDSFKNVVAKINNKVDHITEQVQSDALLWSNNKGEFVATHGKDGAKSKITPLANGDMNANSTDAITGSQLYKLAGTLYIKGNFDKYLKRPTFFLLFLLKAYISTKGILVRFILFRRISFNLKRGVWKRGWNVVFKPQIHRNNMLAFC
ncbi:autotransporter adhesin [Bartonella silvatica]|uniref:Autotransporter adhesin n=1 Tax=Bartonella silvatica TaxID=357760 RepID=A0ABV2HIW6_9HYPH